MPFTVSCAACDSRFLLGDDLFRRKVSGKVVTVKCRNCNAEISVDATEPATLPSHEPPKRARPAPPRPKHREGETATGTPLPIATATATGTPLPAGGISGTSTPLPAGASFSIWDAAEKTAEPPHKGPLPRPHPPQRAASPANEPEFIEDIEEAPPSSSDAPSLTVLKHEVHPPKRGNAKKVPDDFLVNLSAGTGGIMGAPTIDVSGLGSPPAPAVEDLLEVEATELTPRAGTIPLFDMSAVLPVAGGDVKLLGSSLSPSHVDLSVEVERPQTPSQSGKLRERKYVVAPQTSDEAPAPKSRRSGTAVWCVLVAAAAGVLLVVGLRTHGTSQPVVAEVQPAAHAPPVSENVVPVNGGVAAAVPATVAEVSPAPSAADSTPSSKATPNAAATLNAANSTPSNGTSVKSPEAAKPTAAEPARVEAPPTAEKPAEGEKPIAAPKPDPAEPGTDFDRSAAVAALKAAAGEAAACRKDGDPSGTATLTITFAPSGRVTSANIQGPPFAGTPTGGCIATAMRHASVPAFSGDRVTVNKTIVIQ
jgi:hypothetical protein